MKKLIKIGKRQIGEGYPALIIAEIGINHNGNIKLAKKLIDVAKDAGADVAKFQSFKTDDLLSNKDVNYQKIKALELTDNMHYEIMDYCKSKDILFMSSVCDEPTVDFLEKQGVLAYKIASCDLTNLPLVSYIAKKGKPIIISSGFGKLNDIRDALEAIKREGNEEIILLHCIAAYPPKVEEMNLRFMQRLAKEFNVLVGLSDHSMTIEIPQAAVTLGAVCIEKHITLSREMEGFDHKASIEPQELKKMIEGIRIIEKALGNGERQIIGDEFKLSKIMKRSILANKDIKKGEVLKKEMLSIKRPGEGLPAKELPNLIGKLVLRDIKEGDYIKFEDLK